MNNRDTGYGGLVWTELDWIELNWTSSVPSLMTSLFDYVCVAWGLHKFECLHVVGSCLLLKEFTVLTVTATGCS